MGSGDRERGEGRSERRLAGFRCITSSQPNMIMPAIKQFITALLGDSMCHGITEFPLEGWAYELNRPLV